MSSSGSGVRQRRRLLQPPSLDEIDEVLKPYMPIVEYTTQCCTFHIVLVMTALVGVYAVNALRGFGSVVPSRGQIPSPGVQQQRKTSFRLHHFAALNETQVHEHILCMFKNIEARYKERQLAAPQIEVYLRWISNSPTSAAVHTLGLSVYKELPGGEETTYSVDGYKVSVKRIPRVCDIFEITEKPPHGEFNTLQDLLDSFKEPFEESVKRIVINFIEANMIWETLKELNVKHKQHKRDDEMYTACRLSLFPCYESLSDY